MNTSDADFDDHARPNSLAIDVTAEEIRAQLLRITEGPPLVGSARLRAFLEYVVEESLAGRASQIKAFSVAQGVFGGDENFDPETNTIVRVEAGRLRRRISEYYLSTGRDDPIIIDIPKGTYAPVFRRRKIANSDKDAQVAGSGAKEVRTLQWRTVAALAAGVLGTLLVLSGWWYLGPDSSRKSPAAGQVVDVLAKPFVAVLPLDAVSNDPTESRLSIVFTDSIITELSKLSGLSVMAHASMLELGDRPISISSIRREFGASHLLRGGLERDGNAIRVNVHLIDNNTTTTMWADSFNGEVGNILELKDKVADQIVAALSIRLEPSEQAKFLRRHSTDNDAILLFRQALTLMMAPIEMTRITTARRLFQRVSEIDPSFAGGFAGESMSYTLQVIFLKSVNPNEELEIAVTLAEKAIETDTDFGMGYASLGFATTLLGRQEEGLTYARQAIAVQPGDAYSHWMYGVVLMLSGNVETAISHLLEALRLDPAEPRTPYLNLLGIAHYVDDDYAAAIDALERNLERGGPTGPHMDIFRAGAYVELGRPDDARMVIDTMILRTPSFRIKHGCQHGLTPIT